MGRREILRAWAALGVAGALDAGAVLSGLNATPPADELMHLVTGFAAAWVLTAQLLGHVVVYDRRHAWLLGVVAVCAGLALGVVWEWGQWLLRPAYLKGVEDTLSDLLMDALGAAAAGVMLILRLARRSGP